MIVTFLPKDFKGEPATLDDIKLSSIFFGITIGVVIFTAWKAIDQTIPMVRRGTALRSSYLWLVWSHLVLNSTICVLAWLFMDGVIPMGFPILFTMLLIWIFQVQLPLQIIINRTALLVSNKSAIRRLRWAVIIFVTLVQFTVFCIWIPARLQISARYIAINKVWDRIEKCLFALVDLGLNSYFLYIVKSQLIAWGLDKYKALFNFNVCMVVISMSMDILLIGLMDLSTPYCYLQFHSLAYFVKLHIEIVMTDLIIKIVRFSGPTSSARGTVDTSRRYVENTSSWSETRRMEGGDESGTINRATCHASVSAENGPWPFPEDPSLFGIEKAVGCVIEPAGSESTTRDVIDADGHGRRFGGSQQREAKMEDEMDADGHGRRFGRSQQSEARMEDEIDADGHGRRFGEA